MAVRNIQKKADTYLTYFLSTTFAVAIFFIFCSIYYNPEFENYHTGISKINILFKASAILVLIFSIVFVYYANALFIRSRKREIAVFSLLGMRKIEIGRLLFFETLLVGLGAIASGLLIGTLFSRFFSMILIKLMLAGAPGSHMHFRISWQPFVVSIVIFLILFGLNAIYSLRMIYHCELIELLAAEKEGEKAPSFSVVSSILSVGLLGSAYGILLSFNGNEGALKLLGPVAIVCILLAVGTFLLFRNLVIWILSKCKGNIGFYYRTQNFISTSQLVYRIKANSNLFCVITLLSAFTISIMSSISSFYISLFDSMPIYAPYSYLCSNLEPAEKEQVQAAIQKDQKAKLYAVTDFEVLETSASLEGYKVDTNSEYGKIESGIGEAFSLDIIRFSDYQNIVHDTKAIEAKGNKGAIYLEDLQEGTCLFLDGNYDHKYSQNIIGKSIEVQTEGASSEAFKIADVSLYKYMGAAYARTTLVLTDHDYEKCFPKKQQDKIRHYTGIKLENPLESETLYKQLDSMLPNEKHTKSYLEYHQLLFNMYGAYIFIGLFLGVLFLMATGSIIYYKQMMEARDDKGRYTILRKIGMTEREVHHSIRRQIGMVFLMPFVVAMIHTMVILKTYENLLYTITTDAPVLLYAMIVVGLFGAIYGLFYQFTVRGYMKMVWHKNTAI